MVALPFFFRNYEADAVWLSLRSILGRARRIREWEGRTPLLFSHRASSTFPLSLWYVAELTVKWRSTDRLLSPMRTYCVLGYLLYLNHAGHPTHPPSAPFLQAVSPHISEQNCTSRQWCFLIFSTRVNLVKQDGPRFYKYYAASALVNTVVGRPYLCLILALKATYCNRIAQHFRIFLNWQKPGQTEEGGKCRNTANNQKEQRKQYLTLGPAQGGGLSRRGELKLPRWYFSLGDFFGNRKIWQICKYIYRRFLLPWFK